MELPEELAGVVRRQRGLLSRAQLRAAGVSADAVRWRCGRTWRMVLPDVIATFTGSLDPGQKLIAAQLFAGPEAALSARTAAAWHGVTAARPTVVSLQVPRRQSSRRAGFVMVSRTGRADTGVRVRPPLRIHSPGRAVIDAARAASSQEHANSIVIEAVQRRLVDLETVRHEVELTPQRGSLRARVAVAAAETNAWSVPEFDLIGLVAGSTVLPEAWANPELRTLDGVVLPTPDLWIDEVALAVQVHSRKHHARDQDWDGTVMGDGALVEAGVTVLPVTPGRIARDPAAVLVRIERSYLSLTGRARPPIIATRRSQL